ncbi:hypothetical protein [Jatrophihabitans lederbergiae]|uniref:Resolvase/invertase-type recombinase catalytic domain-containing protein n=1 Tax=Jatrophihabitans lederbergiae TaxID=3075547 RepID=A0ABU2JCR6_9ACTN|nr:hypothetical protein [Jatrophihabitans sp. DSM 44399]MDT0262513.1 hypothetical protein [Jatrophihabitans sp. DSM 44399]
MVRRAEYALGKAIRAGQEQGEIRRRGGTATHYDRWSGETGHTLNSTKASPTDFASSDELHNKTGTGIYDLVDDVSEQQFEEAISGSDLLSRANVVRKIQGVKSDKLAPAERLNRIGDMADAGHTSDRGRAFSRRSASARKGPVASRAARPATRAGCDRAFRPS